MNPATLHIRRAEPGDLDAMWRIFHAALAAGDTFPFGDGFDRQTFHAHWFGGHTAYVAVRDGQTVGIYKMGANYPDRGAHVASATYAVGRESQGQGIGKALLADSLERARREGFSAMQFNFVVMTNEAAMGLYRKFGFERAGTLPRAFRHATLGLVDACVLFRQL